MYAVLLVEIRISRLQTQQNAMKKIWLHNIFGYIVNGKYDDKVFFFVFTKRMTIVCAERTFLTYLWIQCEGI